MKRSPAPRRRTPLPRPTKPIARSAPRRSKRRTTTETVESTEYADFVRSLPCRVAVALGHHRQCQGRIHAAHVGPRGLGQKSACDELIPLCAWCHLRDSHDHATRNGALGFIASIPKAERQDWYDDQIGQVRDLFEASRGRL